MSMNRRSFVKVAASTAALSAMSSFAQPQQPVRYAAVGLGQISDIFMKSVSQSKKCKVTGLISGHVQEKTPKYKSLYGVQDKSIYNYETFDEMAHNPEIDAVYIGLPNSMHAEYTIRAAKAGKHVLCEKPMAISSAECRSMIDACKQANVKLMIAYRVHYDPIWLRVKELARSGAIGEIQEFQGGFRANFKAGQWRLDRKFSGGGSLMDLGVYPLNAIRWIAEEEPVSFAAQVATKLPGPRFASVEESVEFSLKMASGVLASAGSSYGVEGDNYLMIYGTEGHLRVEPAYGYQGVRFKGETKTGAVDETSKGVMPYQFTLEADHLADCIRNNTEPWTSGDEGLKDLVAMEGIYKAAGAPIA
ncbi:putative dehydrogenase [Granulicella aggregans]|uniref:Putative dehydrogenase n=1 Tax=Granulicella aggregans TaxID=474949 RepID=A0A7W7ZFL7_9BACT|nr:Gfo/Idh/MocA family oxidoreductase [Granulicella aggregans]MBB5058988.1 putative dehydrogenase [Granulicella aggregans]